MQTLCRNSFLEHRPDTLQAVRKLYDLDKKERIDQAINIIDEWIKKQYHFTNKEFDREYLERLIIASKGSLERTKKRLDKICTSRNLVPEFFEIVNVKDYKKMPAFIDFLLPKLTPDYYHVYILKVISKEMRNCSLLEGYKRLTLEAYGVRVKFLHLLTTSRVVDSLVTFLKPIIGPKLGNRFRVHTTAESIYEVIPKEILPIEYGGAAKPYMKLYEDWQEALSSREFIDYMIKINMYKTDESIRSVDDFNDQYMGMPGTFRSINLD